MKGIVFISILAFTLAIGTPKATAQDESRREVRRELRQLSRELRRSTHLSERDLKRIRQEIEMIHRSRDGRMVILDREMREFSLQQKEMARDMAEAHREMAMKNRELYEMQRKIKIPDVVIPDIRIPEISVYTPHGKNFRVFELGESSSINIRKELSGQTDTAEWEFEVKEFFSRFELSLEGSLSEGSLEIKILKPDGTVYRKTDLTPLADVNLTQRIDIPEEEQSQMAGTWKITVKSDQATGSYALQIQSR